MAKILIPANFAIIIVAATVVAPVSFFTKQCAKSALDNFLTFLLSDNSDSSSSSSPTFITPLITAIVAGVAPYSLTTDSTLLAVFRFSGHGMPCVIIVLSKATIGSSFLIACSTADEYSILIIRFQFRHILMCFLQLFLKHLLLLID